MKKYHWLDLMRFMAALSVVLCHVRGTVFVPYGALPHTQKNLFSFIAFEVTRLGNEAVVLFFVLSGFLVGGRSLERMVADEFRPVDYAIDRTVRIMLPLIPALALTAVVELLLGKGFNVFHLIGNMLSLQMLLVPVFGGNAPLWSLTYEWWFYILVFAIGIAAANRNLNALSAVLLIITFAVFAKLDATYLFCWLIGAFAYMRRSRELLVSAIFFSLGLVLYGLAASQIDFNSLSISLGRIRNYFPSSDIARIILSAGLALFMQQAVNAVPKKYLWVRLDGIGTKLAAASYSLYLTHYPILRLITYFGPKRANINLTSISMFFGVIILCLALSWIFYFLFERHTQFCRRFIKERLLLKTMPAKINA